MENYIGRLLDNRYEILEVIGTGGMAVVYKARCHRLNRIVAIKILKDDLSQDAEFRRRFHAESQAVAMMSHPNIINVYDVSHSDNVDYIVMELIEGITLKQYMEQKGALNWREVLHFATQIAKALEHAHSRGIIHRDIKPHNIIILKDGSVKVADFGIARVSSAQSTLTREALGSVHYISPEQAKGGKIDYRSDLYSLGVVMYEMLTGRPPFDGETPVSVAIQHINAQAVMPRTIQPQIPLGIEQITMRAMKADMDERYESAAEMLWDLDEFRKNPNINLAAPSVPEVQVKKDTTVTAADRAVHGKAAVAAKKKTQSRNKRTGSTGLVAGIICIALAVLGIGYFLYSFFLADVFSGIEEIEVPNFVGQHADSINHASYPQFNIYIGEWLPNDSVEPGYVISQSPKAERMAKVGTSIALTVSSGSATDSMRDLVNQTVQNATTILDNLLLDIKVDLLYETSDLINEDCVIRTVPSAGEPLSAGQVVTLIVSTGPEIKLTPVPGLLGLDEERAVEKLTQANLDHDIVHVDSDEPEGTVIFQSIHQDEMVKEGTTINLQISNGPQGPEDPLNGETTGFPGMPITRIINIMLPDMDDVMMVSVFMDGVKQDEFEVDPATVSNHQIPIALDGVGVHQIEVLIDGALWSTMSYDFDAGEIVY